MIAKEIDGSITKTFIKKLRLQRREYENKYSGGIISNDGTNMLHLLLKIINTSTRINVPNLKYKI